ncbi:MAG: hypothetical protein NT157_05270 [Candidatus Micrarchaeota archaeon]|nr:hypothetical protein [Candidatus Micrarchaeota archaeon]
MPRIFDIKPTREARNCQLGSEFVFKMPDGKELGKARNIVEIIVHVRKLPIESLEYHVSGDHLVPWLVMIGEKGAAVRINGLSRKGEKLREELLRRL